MQVLTVSRGSTDGPVSAGCTPIAAFTIIPFFLVTMTPFPTASEKLPLVGRSPPAAQGSKLPDRLPLDSRRFTSPVKYGPVFDIAGANPRMWVLCGAP